MGDPRCERSDLPKSMCAHCRGDTGEDPAPPAYDDSLAGRRPGPCITALYDSVCPCGEPIHKGDLIVKWTEGDGRWYHESC